MQACLNFGGGILADLSLGASNGAEAVDFVRRQVGSGGCHWLFPVVWSRLSAAASAVGAGGARPWDVLGTLPHAPPSRPAVLQVVAVPPLRPLALAVKAFLRERGLNEVFTGGLSSYSVVNMVLAHLLVSTSPLLSL